MRLILFTVFVLLNVHLIRGNQCGGLYEQDSGEIDVNLTTESQDQRCLYIIQLVDKTDFFIETEHISGEGNSLWIFGEPPATTTSILGEIMWTDNDTKEKAGKRIMIATPTDQPSNRYPSSFKIKWRGLRDHNDIHRYSTIYSEQPEGSITWNGMGQNEKYMWILDSCTSGNRVQIDWISSVERCNDIQGCRCFRLGFWELNEFGVFREISRSCDQKIANKIVDQPGRIVSFLTIDYEDINSTNSSVHINWKQSEFSWDDI